MSGSEEAVTAHAPRQLAQVKLVHWQSPPVVGALLLALDLVNLSGGGSRPEAGLMAIQVEKALTS